MPPLDSTNFVITGTNLPAISRDSPNWWKASATSAVRPVFPGRELSRVDSSECSAGAGAALSRPFMPGTAADTLPNSSALSRLLAKANSAPAPPRACGRVIESCFVNCPTSCELEPAVGATDVWASICTPVRTKRPHSQTAARLVSNRCVLDIISPTPGCHKQHRSYRPGTDHTPVPLFAALVWGGRVRSRGLTRRPWHLPITVVTSP